ncbi:unnamed protein product [Ilex paraguariensis]|uniref:Protein SirB1 N-terminal domain-containing protein n=1 Tax=Ilex paraguariensis TaxID=185542 RepID=A0ABC8RKF1_9AQUA
MSGLHSPWITAAFPPSSSSSIPSSSSSNASKSSRNHLSPSTSLRNNSCGGVVCRSQFAAALNEPKFILHDALDSSGINTVHAKAARDGYCSQIWKFSDIDRDTSITINIGADLAKTALYIAAEDDSLISHSSVPLPVDAFVERLDDLSMGYCSSYHSSFRASPERFLQCLERYLYVNKGFRRINSRNQLEQRALYLHSVLTHRSGSASMLSLIYSEILKMLHLWGLLSFDIEIFFPHDSYSFPRGYHKQKTKESDQPHIMTSQSLLVEMLMDLKNAFWPFQFDPTRSLFLRAAQAANCTDRSNNVEESGLELASAKAAQHRLERGVWTTVHYGDMRRALAEGWPRVHDPPAPAGCWEEVVSFTQKGGLECMILPPLQGVGRRWCRSRRYSKDFIFTELYGCVTYYSSAMQSFVVKEK